MQLIRFTLLALSAMVLAACSDGSSNHQAPQAGTEERPALDLTFSEPPIELPNITADYAADVSYGDAERNVFDIYLPDCDEPTPVVIYIHGGGFTGGDKSHGEERDADWIREFLQSCIAWAGINYTLLEIPEEGGDLEAAAAQGGVLTSLMDSARALQFMRYHFESLNLDIDNVALYGGSAGAGTSLWLGTHDDLADPENTDPVLRESTRVKAVGALATQATYDILAYEEILLPITEPLAPVLGGTDVVTLASKVGAINWLLAFLGISSPDELDSPELDEYRAEIDMLALMDAGDAPIYTENFETGIDDPLNMLLHHALHALTVKARADEVGLESVAYSRDPNWPLEDPSGETLTSFLIRHIR